MPLFPEQCRAARGLLDWTQHQLAAASGLSRSTIKDFERHRHALNRSSEELLLKALLHGGVELLYADRGAQGMGVCLKMREAES
jgi:transcriptional regulator with XRE-family HTH domain